MSMSSTAKQPSAAHNVGPLAWLITDVHRSVRSALVALRAFDSAQDVLPGHAAHKPDTTSVRLGMHQLLQSAGALEMIDLPAPAMLVRSIQSSMQSLVAASQPCHPPCIEALESAGAALMEYLHLVLAGSHMSAVSLFPQYQQLYQGVPDARVHPADLWACPSVWQKLSPAQVEPLALSAEAGDQFHDAVLAVLRAGDLQACQRLAQLSAGLSMRQDTAGGERFCTFWAIAAAAFTAAAQGLIPVDVYFRLTVARLPVELMSDLRGECVKSEALARELLFFCAQAASPLSLPHLAPVRRAYGLAAHAPVDYNCASLGRFDPLLLREIKRGVEDLRQSWGAFSDGQLAEAERAQQLSQKVQDLTARLPSASLHQLVRSLHEAVGKLVSTNDAPNPALALEVATAVLFLDGHLSEMPLTSDEGLDKAGAISQRLQQVASGASLAPFERWMEDIYRGGAAAPTASVVGELKLNLSEIERVLEGDLADPSNASSLPALQAKLTQMRSVLKMLDLDDATKTVSHLTDWISQTGAAGAPSHAALRSQDAAWVSNNVAALGLLLDMLAQQPRLAKSLFYFDDADRSLKLVSVNRGTDAVLQAAPVQPFAVRVTSDNVSSVLPQPSLADADQADPEDAQMRAVFITEALEVIENALAAHSDLGNESSDSMALTRRAFHTLKGGARMLGFNELGEASWAMEQLLNGWMADSRPMTTGLSDLIGQALSELQRWVLDLESGNAAHRSAAAFRASADAMRLQDRYVSLQVTASQGVPPSPETPSAEAVAASMAVPAETMADHDGRLQLQPLAQVLTLDASLSAPAADLTPDQPQEEPEALSLAAHSPNEQGIPIAENKRVGHLEIDVALYNVFLQEADEWSRRLVSDLSEWALDRDSGPPPDSVRCAHSLAGSASAIGLEAVSGLSRALEAALRRAQQPREQTAFGADRDVDSCLAAAESIRHVLHQFAVGALVPAPPALLDQLSSCFPPSANLGLALAVGQPAGFDVEDVLNQELLDTFREEANDLIAELAASLRHWQTGQDGHEARAQLLRGLHTLKGSARLAGAMHMGELAHRMESQIGLLHGHVLQEARADELAVDLDAMQASLALIGRSESAPVAAPLAQLPLAQEAAVQLESEQVAASQAEWPSATMAPATVAPLPSLLPTETDRSSAVTQVVGRSLASSSVRVRADVLDGLMNQAGEVMTTRSRVGGGLAQLRVSMDELSGNLEKMRIHMRELDSQAEAQLQTRAQLAQDTDEKFDPLEFDRYTRVQELTRMMAESVNDVATVQRTIQRTIESTEDDLVAQARQTRDMQHSLLRTRMVEFDAMAERLYRVVRQTGLDTGKQVRLDIVGGGIEMDRGVLEKMMPSFEHLLRNAVVHGIESPERRVREAKPAAGHIVITLRQQGNDVSLTFKDDGAGLDLPRIRDKALAQGLVSSADALASDDAMNLIFRAGFSTVDQVTELAGRGVGMDVVRSEIMALGGRIDTQSVAGQHTSFTLVVPLTTAVTQVVMVRTADLVFGIPASLIDMVRRANQRDIEQAYNTGQYAYAGESLPFFWGGALLQHSPASSAAQAKTQPIVVCRSAAQGVALHVDEVLGNQEVLVRHLGAQLSRLPGLAGVTVLASGSAALIYNPVALAAVYGQAARALSFDPAQPDALEAVAGQATPFAGNTQPLARASGAPLVLVVDDSITVRRVTQRLLEREGYRVGLAADGAQALVAIAQEQPAVVLSDIEMPRMDGFELLRAIRSNPASMHLPVIMITSRIASKHRDHAIELGAKHYLGKPYSEEELIRLIGACLQEHAAA